MRLIHTKLPPNLSIIQVMNAVTDDRGAGFCLVCGEERNDFTEPDACNYPCTEKLEPLCGETVFGAEEILIMFVP
jgi:hypothetical protein